MVFALLSQGSIIAINISHCWDNIVSTFFLLRDDSKNKITRIQIHNDKEILLPTQPQTQIIPFLNPSTHTWGLGLSTKL